VNARIPALVRKIGEALEQLLPDHRGKHLGVAVSGGPDSVALCHALVLLSSPRRLQLTALHVNHCLRPEAEAEQHLVETLCQRWQIPCVVTSVTPPEKKNGVENWARTERYRFFHQVREQSQLDAVVLAHTLDDQAETVLFRLLRGTAKRGLIGIPPTREGWLIRPLLDCTRQEVMAYLAAEHLPYAIDPSNADCRYTRNRIRHLLLPFLEREFSPRIRRHLVTLATTARAEEAWLEALARDASVRVVDSRNILSLLRLSAEPHALQSRILRQWLEQSGQTHEVSFAHIESVCRLAEGRIRGKVTLPGTLCVRREGDILTIEKKSEQCQSPPYCYALAPGQEVLLPQGNWRVAVSPLRPWSGPPHLARSLDPWFALFDGACLSETFLVRSFQSGDRIQPLGMRGHKKVHDVFIDAKVPLRLRCVFPLLVIGQEIAWVPGHVRGEKAKVTADTRFVCQIAVSPLPEK
jgi:tRNA(Ile)-lysidine synthase